MSLAASRPSAFDVPQTQNTAPVVEYRCLYTRDLRRKQKRWQDGFLKYHTFNRRIMVYDLPRNFIGDAHYAQGQGLEEGDELSLDKGGVIVQVADVIEHTQTDVTELVHRKPKRPMVQQLSPPLRAVRPTTDAVVPKHRSLCAMLNTPAKVMGRCHQPVQSPFDLRHAQTSPALGHQNKKRKTTSTMNLDSRPAHVIDLCSDEISPLKSDWQPSSDGHPAALSPLASASAVFPEPSIPPVARARSKPRQLKPTIAERAKHIDPPQARVLPAAETGNNNKAGPLQPQASVADTENAADEQRPILMLASRAPGKLLVCQRPSAAPLRLEQQSKVLSDDENAAARLAARRAESKRRLQQRLVALDLDEPDNEPQITRKDDDAAIRPKAAEQNMSVASAPARAKRMIKAAARKKQGPAIDLKAGADPLTSTLLAKPFKPVAGPEAAQKRFREEEQQVRESDVGPWSREAFDLFDWRPPEMIVT